MQMGLADLGNGYGLAEIGPATKATQAAKSGGEKDYGRGVRAAARGLVSDIFDMNQFLDSMEATIFRGLPRAFKEGMKQAGADPKNLDTAAFIKERIELNRIISANQAALFGFLSYLIKLRDDLYRKDEQIRTVNAGQNPSPLTGWQN